MILSCLVSKSLYAFLFKIVGIHIYLSPLIFIYKDRVLLKMGLKGSTVRL